MMIARVQALVSTGDALDMFGVELKTMDPAWMKQTGHVADKIPVGEEVDLMPRTQTGVVGVESLEVEKVVRSPVCQPLAVVRVMKQTLVVKALRYFEGMAA